MFIAVPLSAIIKILVNRSQIAHIFLKTFEKKIFKFRLNTHQNTIN